ncbi:MAG TPA: MASE4 domain-containing protein [Acetobacteraceae bacterium]|nr:MASE4 domain-containing protein [Acetobacteraceae bacterium]
MPQSQHASSERTVFLSTLPASPSERQSAAVVALAFLVFAAAAAPFARVKLAEVWAFIPSYQSALLVNDLITATLLFAQFAILGSRPLLILAAGYLFTALMTVPHALSFPRLFAPSGLIGAGPQTTAWLYMIWHSGFPLAVIAFALYRDQNRLQRTWPAIVAACVFVVAVVGGAAALATVGHDLLPALMRSDGYTSLLPVVTTIVWSLSLIALLILWRRPAKSVLDVWLMVVMTAWLFDVGLSALINAGRFDLGFYVGRMFGLTGSTLVLLVLLIETGAVYSRMARRYEAERTVRDRQLHELQAELIHVSRLTELGQMVSALAHEVNQPLTAAGSYVRAGRRLVQAGDIARADEALQKGVDQVTRASQVIQRLRQFVKKAEAQRDVEDLRQTIEEAAALALLGTEEARLQLEIELAADTPPVLIDKVQVQQVLLNLIRNAVEAMQASARCELAIGTVPVGDGMVEVRVADTGPGLAADIRDRLFQPFVTTKASGMGVGLSICRSIVQAHGGRMWVAENPGGGTAFHFTIPAAPVTQMPRTLVAATRA